MLSAMFAVNLVDSQFTKEEEDVWVNDCSKVFVAY
jgi:hypothetical protein